MTRVVPRSELPKPPPEEVVRLSVGMRLGRYELLCPIAEGGMAQVWAAEQTGDLGFRKVVALKTIRPDYAYDASFRAMFLDEAQLASRIRHGNVVEVLDLGVDGDIVFQAMALIDGVATSEWMRSAKDRLPIGVSIRVLLDMLHGLHAAHTLKDDEGHDLGLVHRDVSPQNVLIGSDGVAKLADFGIAKAFGRAAEETFVGDVKGKLAYVAPEQLRGLPAAPQSDVYSAGVVFWELLTAQRLFPIGNDSQAKRHQMITRDPRAVVPGLPGSICEIAMRALNDSPFERYESALEMADALEEAARRENIVVSHRAVATALEKDLGTKLEARRERLRQAKKRAGLQPTPTPRARVTGPISAPLLPSAPLVAAEPASMFTAPIAVHHPTMPITRVLDPLELSTDTVTIGETPRPIFAPPPKRSVWSSPALPLGLAAALMLALFLGITCAPAKQTHPPPDAVNVPVPAPVPVPAVVAPPSPSPASPPYPATPVSPATSATSATPASPAASASPTPHRPPLPHGRTRTTPSPAPAPKPATSPTIGPRFENPY